jgi:hypothetical protein
LPETTPGKVANAKLIGVFAAFVHVSARKHGLDRLLLSTHDSAARIV